MLRLLIAFLFSSFFKNIFLDAKSVKVFDLSHDMNTETIYWPNGTPFQLFIQHKGPVNSTIDESEDNFWYEANDFKTAEHSGTHLDAPVHFARNQWSVDQIPPNRFIGPVSIIDLRETVKDNAEYEITEEEILQWEFKKKRKIDKLVILWTGWASKWTEKEKYLGTKTNDVSFLHFPGLHPNAAKWLVNQREIHGIGIDTASIDYGQSTSFLSHRTLAKHNIFLIENLDTREMDIENLPQPILIVNPLKISSGSGSPIRPFLVFGMESGDVQKDATLEKNIKLDL